MKPPELADRYDLDDVIGTTELDAVARSLTVVSGLSAGIVRMPPTGQMPPSDRSQFHLWRLTDPKAFAFCSILRSIPALDDSCMQSDLKYAQPAYENREPVIYECLPCGLIDMVAAVEVAGRHVANIYIGRARRPQSTFEMHYEHVLATLEKRRIEPPPELRERLEAEYNKLPVRSDEQLEIHKPLLSVFADLLSQRANRQVALKVLAGVGEEVTDLDEKRSIQMFYSTCGAILNFDSGSIFLARHRGLEVNLEAALLDWGDGQPSDVSFPVDSQAGLIPLVYREAVEARGHSGREPAVLCTCRTEMDKLTPPGYADSREMRSIDSFIAVPIQTEQNIMGVLEIGSRRQNAFTPDDKYLLNAAATYLAVSLKACRNRSCLIDMVAKTDLRQLLEAIVQHLPELTDGIGCSVFLTDVTEPRSEAVLFATSELRKTLIGNASYRPSSEDGLTGWVLETRRVLNVPGGPNARSDEQLRKIDPKLKWTGKFAYEDPTPLNYRSLAFLASPIRTEDGRSVGVLRIGARQAGDFSTEDAATVRACADALGSVVARVGIQESVNELKKEIRSLRSKTLAGQRQILQAIRQSPHSFVMLTSSLVIALCALSLALFYLLKIEVINPGFAWFGCFAFATYWLMGKLSEFLQRRTTEASSSPAEV